MKRVSCEPTGRLLLAGDPVLCKILLFVLRIGQPAEIFPPAALSVCSGKTYCSLYAVPSCSHVQAHTDCSQHAARPAPSRCSVVKRLKGPSRSLDETGRKTIAPLILIE